MALQMGMSVVTEGYNGSPKLPTTLDLENLNSEKIDNGNQTFSPLTENSSCASTPVDKFQLENGYFSTEDELNESEEETHNFVKSYVDMIFDSSYEVSYEDKAKFGELMKDANARMWFAKYVDAHRSHVKCVDETTFYKLVHSFALVLFECGEDDDYMPGKTLMNMSFTYYYIPDQKLFTTADFDSEIVNNRLFGRPKARSDSDSQKKPTLLQRFRKEVEACKQVFQDTPSLKELKESMKQTKKATKCVESSPAYSRSVSYSSAPTAFHPDMCSPCRKIFLYDHLKNQLIWKSLRFWNAAFFTAVHAERKRRCSTNDWSSLSADEKDSNNDAIVNITFGQLGTFVNNMKCLGLSKEICFEFLRKQSTIGGIEDDNLYYKMLVEQIEDDVTF